MALFLVEAWVVTYQLRFGRLDGLSEGHWLSIIPIAVLVRVLIVAFAATVMFGWRVFRDEVVQRHYEATAPVAGSWMFFLAHVALFAGYLGFTAWILEGETSNPLSMIVWGALGLASLAFFGLSVLAADIWIHLARRGWLACLAGLAVGAVAFVAGQVTVAWWQPLSDSTFWLVRSLMNLVTADVVCEPDKYIVGTSTFEAEIAPACSGYEGIGLIWIFVAAYLWLCRGSLHFPHAFLLIPVGTLVIWLTNALRITATVLIGTYWSPEIAERGFHSQAGWLAFNAVGLGLIAISYRWRFFRKDNAESLQSDHLNPAAPYLVPFVVLMAALMICTAFSAGFDYLYPIRVAAVGLALMWFWREYANWSWSWSWGAVGIGVLVFIMWMALELVLYGLPVAGPFAGAFETMPAGWGLAWLVCRVLGSVVTVPCAEELAFRGFLSRRLQRADFQEIAPGVFTWFSFLVSSVLFGLMHQDRWLAATLGGMLYAWALYRRQRIFDAVLAHATTNALIAGFVLLTGAWSMWT